MKYIVTVDGRRVEVDLAGDRATVDGRELPVSLRDVPGTPVRLVMLGDDVHRVVVRRREGRGRYVLWLDGYTYEVEAFDERTQHIRDLTAQSSRPAGPAPLIAPMPGLVVRVSVGAGDEVAAGQGLVVMEAMKMENELRAPGAGRVKTVHVAAGTAVEKGALLIELE